jgi:acyl-CoA thioesterase
MDDNASRQHPLDKALRLTPTGVAGVLTGSSSPDYWNMVGPFGGTTAAVALNAVLQHPQLLGEPVALTVNYAGAILAGDFTVTAKPARTNRSTQHWTIELSQRNVQGEPELMLTATAITATRRSTWGVDDATPPQVPRPSDLPAGRPMSGVEWIKHYDMRFLEGAFPATWDGQLGDSLTRLWVRDRPERALDFCALAALSDVFFPRVYLRRALRVPAGTVSMTTYFHADSVQLGQAGNGFVLAQARAQALRNGFFDHSGQLWSETGLLLATTQQIVYYKE